MIRKHGGIYFWNVGRVGGSFFLKKKPKPVLADKIAAYYRDFDYAGEAVIAALAANVIMASAVIAAAFGITL